MSDGTITFSGQIIDGNVDRSTLVTVKEVPGQEYPWVVTTKSGTELASLPTEDAAWAFVNQASWDVLYR